MTLYLDASFLVALFAIDHFNERASSFLTSHTPELLVSDFAAAEFASAIARRVRMGDLTAAEARSAFDAFDTWVMRVARRPETTPQDIAAAAAFLRRLDLNLRTPDALNIAIAQRLDASLATFDVSMRANAEALGVTVADV